MIKTIKRSEDFVHRHFEKVVSEWHEENIDIRVGIYKLFEITSHMIMTFDGVIAYEEAVKAASKMENLLNEYKKVLKEKTSTRDSSRAGKTRKRISRKTKTLHEKK